MPVRPDDLVATLHHALGIPADTVLPDLSSRPRHLAEGEPIHALSG